MTEFLDFFSAMWTSIAELLDQPLFDVYGIAVSFFDLILGYIVIIMIIAVFWKGVRAN